LFKERLYMNAFFWVPSEEASTGELLGRVRKTDAVQDVLGHAVGVDHTKLLRRDLYPSFIGSSLPNK
jgi:hypothetical protein